MPDENQNLLRLLMLNLIYPAAHGAGLVWAVSHWAEMKSFDELRVDTFIAIWLLIYFGSSYVSSLKSSIYNTVSFVFDMIEIAIIFLCFIFLGYVTQKIFVNYAWVFGLLFFVPILQFFWRLTVHIKRKSAVVLGLIASLSCAITFFTVPIYPWAAPAVGVAALYILTFAYFFIEFRVKF